MVVTSGNENDKSEIGLCVMTLKVPRKIVISKYIFSFFSNIFVSWSANIGVMCIFKQLRLISLEVFAIGCESGFKIDSTHGSIEIFDDFIKNF